MRPKAIDFRKIAAAALGYAGVAVVARWGGGRG